MTSTREALSLLRSVDPAPTPRGPVEPAAQPRRDGVPRRRSRVGLVLAGTAAAAVVALGLGVVPLPWTHGAASPAAAAALDRAATAADITARDEAARPDQWWRIQTEGTSLAGFGSGAVTHYALVRQTRTEYVSVDGSRPSWTVASPSQTVRMIGGGPAPDLPQDPGQTWTTNLSPNQVPGTWQMANPAWLAALPRDTDALRDRLYDDTSGHGRSHDGEVLVYVADVLRTGQVPADLRAGLFRVLETVPGVDIVQRHEDGLISIGRLEGKDGERQEIVIDPDTGEYVGERTVQVKTMAGIPAGTVVGDTTVRRTVVDGVPAAVTESAEHWTCTASPDGAVSCDSVRK